MKMNHINSVCNTIKDFFLTNKKIVITSLGMGIAGIFLYRTIVWFYESKGTAKKTDELTKEIIKPKDELKKYLKELVVSKDPFKEPGFLPENDLRNDAEFQKTYAAIPKFAGYAISTSSEDLQGGVLTGMSLRPSNLFFQSLFKDTTIKSTMPGSGKLFAFNESHDKISAFLKEKGEKDPDGCVTFSAKGVPGNLTKMTYKGEETYKIDDLSEIYGEETYEISHKEILDTLKSQTIYLSSLLPKPFYIALKEAFLNDKIVILPGDDSNPSLLKELNTTEHMKNFLEEVKKDPSKFGITSEKQLNDLMAMTIYQIGSMVIKKENYRIFVDGKMKIVSRKANQKDEVCLLNACGIRGFHAKKTPEKFNLQIMTETFKAAFKAAEDGHLVFPAVGMGVWKGDPGLYWTAFLDAVVEKGESFDLIFINPGHQKTAGGKYQGCMGEELQTILIQYLNKYQDNPKAISNLKKIMNAFEDKKDLVQLARELKLAYPEKNVSLFNASDPDVTLGYHVGEYTNNMPHTFTTEENYTAMGTNGVCFEEVTDVHKEPHRIIQA